MTTKNITHSSHNVSSASATDTQTTLIFPVIDDRLGNLRIVEPIAAGGMAVVYKVKHEELEVIRAVKVLKPGFTEETRQRLFTEAKISANLHHPNIVQIYNIALWKGAVPYIEMEYVHGSPLRDLIARYTRLPFLVASAIASIVCRALAFAHRQSYSVYGKTYHGLVHRDIKPANILIAADGAVKLADFGIALPGFVSIHTTDSVIMGTSPYLSPEQIKGETLDQRCDIYSLGTVLYEMLTGVKAFPQPLMPALMHAKLKGRYQAVKSLAPEVPSIIASIVDKSLSPDKEKRYADAGSFGGALEKAIGQFTDQPSSQIVKDFVEGTRAERIPFINTKKALSLNVRYLVGLSISLLIIATLIGAGVFLLYRREHPKRKILPFYGTATAAKDSVLTVEESRPAGAVETKIVDSTVSTVSRSPTSIVYRPQEVRVRETKPSVKEDQARRSIAHPQESPINDSLSLFERGIQSYLSGQYEEANVLLYEARRTEAMPGSAEWLDITYHLALSRSALFDRKPNAENRFRACQAWEEFVAAACSGEHDDTRCAQALAEQKRLTR